jgi:hypothetical protein
LVTTPFLRHCHAVGAPPPEQAAVSVMDPPVVGSWPLAGVVRVTVQPLGGFDGADQLTVTDAVGPWPTPLPPKTVYVFAPAVDCVSVQTLDPVPQAVDAPVHSQP